MCTYRETGKGRVACLYHARTAVTVDILCKIKPHMNIHYTQKVRILNILNFFV